MMRIAVFVGVVALLLTGSLIQAESVEVDELVDALVSDKVEAEIDGTPLMFLETEADASKRGPECAQGAHCPMADGICCDGGQYCCPASTRCGSGGKCRRSDTELALQAAKAKMQEEGKKTIRIEARTKSKTERGQKALQEERAKNKREAKSKRGANRREAAGKRRRRARERKLKNAKNRRERASKQAENRRKKSERTKKERRGKESRKKNRTEKQIKAERTRESKRKEKQRKDDRTRDMQRKKSQEKQRKSAEKNSKQQAKMKEQASFKTFVSDEDSPRQGHRLAENQALGRFKGMFTYMLWIRPQAIQPGWNNIFHKGGADSQRNPAVWLYPGGTRLHIRSGVGSNWNAGVDPANALPLMKWTHVTIQHSSTQMRVLYNSVEVGTANMGAPNDNNGPLFFSNPWYPAASVRVAHFQFAPRVLPAQVISRAFNKKPKPFVPRVIYQHKAAFRPARSRKLVQGSAVRPSFGSYGYMFWIKLTGKNPGWTSVIHRGGSNMQRQPALFIHPGNTDLCFVSGYRNNWNWHIYHRNLPLFAWTHVALAHREGSFRIWINGANAGLYNIPSPITDNIVDVLYAGDPWYEPALADISDLRVYDGAFTGNEVTTQMSARRIKESKAQMVAIHAGRISPRRGHAILGGSSPQFAGLGDQIAWMFWVKPMGARNGHWCNLLHKGHSDHQRNPAVWFYPASYRLHIRSGEAHSWNHGMDPDRQMPYNQWTHVAWTHRLGELRVYLNGAAESPAPAPWGPAQNNGPLYISNPWYFECQAIMGDIRMYKNALPTPDVISEAAQRKQD